MRPRGDTQRRYNEAIQCLSGKKLPEKIKTDKMQEKPNLKVQTRRLGCPPRVVQLWTAIGYIRQQKQIPNLNRIAAYMKRLHDLSIEEVERDLQYAVHDGLIVIKTVVGCKGSKVGIEQDGYRVLEDDIQRDGHDWYCFTCHKGGQLALCSTCYRAFHQACIENLQDLTNKFICDICKMTTEGRYKLELQRDQLNILLSYTSVRLKEKTKELHRIPNHGDDSRHSMFVYEPMDLITMEQKIKNKAYWSLDEFYIDALQILHNVLVFYGELCKISVLAKQMISDCDYDLNEIQQCKECYRMSNQKEIHQWFCQPCDPPHELIFAKQRGYPFWPAKVIKKADGVYDVRFFGALHQRACVEENYTRPITTGLKQMGLKDTPSLKRALTELKHHQQLVEQFLSGKPIQLTPCNTVLPRSNRTSGKMKNARHVSASTKRTRKSLSIEKRVKAIKGESTTRRSEVIDRKIESGLKKGEHVSRRSESVVKRSESVVKRSESVIKKNEHAIKNNKTEVKATVTEHPETNISRSKSARSCERVRDCSTGSITVPKKRRRLENQITKETNTETVTNNVKDQVAKSKLDGTSNAGDDAPTLVRSETKSSVETKANVEPVTSETAHTPKSSICSTSRDVKDGSSSDDHNIVSSSSQEAIITYATSATQTLPCSTETEERSEKESRKAPAKDPSKENCNCKKKYAQTFKDLSDGLEAHYREQKAKALQELSERLENEKEMEKKKVIQDALLKFRTEIEESKKKCEEEIKLRHQEEVQKLMEQHKQQISEIKKKQWCYNCESEAIYHCCWNTAYCTVECQQIHWHKEHKRSCRRKR